MTAYYSVCWPSITNNWKEKQGEEREGTQSKAAVRKVQYRTKTLGEKGSTNRQTIEVSKQAPCSSYRRHVGLLLVQMRHSTKDLEE